MNRLATLIVGLGMGIGMQAFAQAMAEPPLDGTRPPRGEESAQGTTPLTEAQQAQVKAILSRYDAKTLTADQARSIHEAFRQAGLRAGPAMGDTIRAAGFDPDRLRELAPPPARPPGDGEERRLPRPGDIGASTFMPPGKVCDYFGFQYMRDIDAAGKGHNPAFLNRVVGNVLHILNAQQRKLFEDLAAEQAGQFEKLALKRMPLIKAFHRELDGAIPKGSSGLGRGAVLRYVGDIFGYDAELSYRRAEVFGKVAASLTAEQKTALGKMQFGDFNTWADLDERDAIKRPSPDTSPFYNVAFMTYASEFFSWYAGRWRRTRISARSGTGPTSAGST